MEPSFNSIQELKSRIMPALRVRRRELKKIGILVTEEDLWNYFVNRFWKNATNLSLAEMVNNVLNDDVTLGDEIYE